MKQVTKEQLAKLKQIGFVHEDKDLPTLNDVRDWFAENEHEKFENLYILPETEMYEPGFKCTIWVKREMGYMPLKKVELSCMSSYSEALSEGINAAVELALKKYK